MKHKKHSSGFVPVQFKLAGKILLPAGIVLVIIEAVDYLVGKDLIPTVVLFVGIGFIVIGLYLLIFVPRE